MVGRLRGIGDLQASLTSVLCKRTKGMQTCEKKDSGSLER